MFKNYFNNYGYTDEAGFSRLTVAEMEENVKAIKRDRVIALALRILMVFLAINMFVEPVVTNLPPFTGFIMGCALLYLSSCMKNVRDELTMKLDKNLDGINNYGAHVASYSRYYRTSGF